MTKTEFVEQLMKDNKGLFDSKRQATDAVSAVLDEIIKSTKKDKSVAFSGFGKFEQVKRAARVGRNPRTGEAIKIKAHKTPVFRPGLVFKEAIK